MSLVEKYGDKIKELKEEDLDGFNIDQVKCRSCSGYGNCGYKTYHIYHDKVVSICNRTMKKLQCDRDGIPFDG